VAPARRCSRAADARRRRRGSRARGIAIIEATDYVLYRADALTDLAEVLRPLNRAAEAAAAAASAWQLYEQKGNVVAARQVAGLIEELRVPSPV